MKFRYIPPNIIQYIFSDFIWKTKNNKLLLTFDDGPNPSTTKIILKQLQKNKIKVMFFCVGNNLRRNPELVSEILSEGHSIGNHTYDHKAITKLSDDEFLKEIESFNSAWRNISNREVEYFRPPYGKFNFRTNKLLKSVNLKSIMWTLITYDYKNNSNIVKFALKKYLRSNSIIVMHDNNKSGDILEDSIKMLVEEAYSKGYQFGEPEECLK